VPLCSAEWHSRVQCECLVTPVAICTVQVEKPGFNLSLLISIFGLGYVGSVTAACFAHMGHRVTGIDVNRNKVEMLESGKSPILEAGMMEMVAENRAACRLHATTDACTVVQNTDISFICVGTPSLRSGKLDLSHVERVCGEVGSALKKKAKHHVIVLRSTALPGTTENVVVPILEKESGLRAGEDFTVCYNPEFMREGSAVADFLHPACTVLGAGSPKDLELVKALYNGLPAPIFETTIRVAEMVKYVANTFHAVKVGFANELGTLCKHLQVDTESVMRIFTSDSKLNISSAYLRPGFAFGGSCLPKDLRSLTYRARELDLVLPLLESIAVSNDQHLLRALELTLQTGKKKIALLGLSFKAATDDLRESPQVQLAKRLLGEGCDIRIWDANVSLGRLVGSNRQYIEEVIPHIGALMRSSMDDAVRGAEVVIIATKEVDCGTLREYLAPDQIVIDLVNCEESHRLGAATLSYEGICW
jgi:GDP-mannose 6-dehydrogenase